MRVRIPHRLLKITDMIGVIITLVISLIVSIFWVNGIDSMNQKHPDYDGKDFLNEE